MIIRGYEVIESDVLNVCEGIREYDRTLSVIFNEKMKEFQVYENVENKAPCMVTFSNNLDRRLIDKLMKADNKTEYGFSEKIADIEDEKIFEEHKQKEDGIKFNKIISREMQKGIKEAKYFI